MPERDSAYAPDDLIAEARRQRSQVEEMAESLGEALFAQRPSSEKWSIGECIEHLALINTIYLDAIDAAAAHAEAQGLVRAADRRAGRHGWLGDLFVRSLEPPPRVKGGAFKPTVPTRRPKAEVIERFLAQQDRLIRTIGEVRALDFARVRLRSPFFKPLKLSLGQALGAMIAHNRRHIWQAEGVLALLRTNPQDRS